jgi:hypothetical protein
LDRPNHVANQQQVLGLDVLFLLASTTRVKMLGQNHFAEPNQYVLIFLHPEFTVQCTDGVALRCIAMVSDLSTRFSSDHPNIWG